MTDWLQYSPSSGGGTFENDDCCAGLRGIDWVNEHPIGSSYWIWLLRFVRVCLASEREKHAPLPTIPTSEQNQCVLLIE